jgi:hypothetical protein
MRGTLAVLLALAGAGLCRAGEGEPPALGRLGPPPAPVELPDSGGEAEEASDKVGVPPPNAAQRLDNAVDLITGDILTVVKVQQFIDDQECDNPAGAGQPIDRNDLLALIRKTRAKTELLATHPRILRALINRPSAMAVGMTAKVKEAIEKANSVTIGTPGMNAILLGGPNGDPEIAHEFLHILLRQLSNEALGGGKRIGDTNASDAIARHHRLTQALSWGLATEQAFDFSKRRTPPGCGNSTP